MHFTKHSLGLLCGLAMAALPVSGFGAEIRIGALIDQSGPSTSPLYRSAIELAQKQMNTALAHSGSKTRFVIEFADSKSQAALAQSEAIRLINVQKVAALVTMSSGETVAVNKLNYDPASPAAYKVALTCFQCSSGFINKPDAQDADAVTQAALRDADHWLNRVFYIANYEAAVQAQLAQKYRKANGQLRVGILADVGHRSLATAIAETLPQFNKQASAEIAYFSASASLAQDWEKLLNSAAGQPDVVIVAMMPQQATEAIKAYRQAGHAIPVLANNSLRRNYILPQLGEAGNGVEGSSVQLADTSPSGRAFLRAFKAAYQQNPEMTSSGAYDATVSLMLAALVAEKTTGAAKPEAIRAALAQINAEKGRTIRPGIRDFQTALVRIRQGKPINYEGAYNRLQWNAAGDIYPALTHWKIEGGQFVEYELYQCNPQKPLCQ